MVNELTVPWLSYENIRVRADEFLNCYHPSGDIPVPIEEIIEFQLNIDIVPIPGLRDIIETDGFISSDLTDLSVDQYSYEHIPNRYRFTLAHEIGHYVLHAGIYRRRDFKSIREWKTFVDSIPEGQHRWLEWQAYSFGGLILVPKERLVNEVENAIKIIQSKDISLENQEDLAWDWIAEYLAKKEKFFVSADVINKRIIKDKIIEKYKSG